MYVLELQKSSDHSGVKFKNDPNLFQLKITTTSLYGFLIKNRDFAAVCTVKVISRSIRQKSCPVVVSQLTTAIVAK